MNFVQIADFAMATQRLNFWKKYSKIFFSEAIRGMKLKLCINVHDISLYMHFIFLLLLSMCFYCYGNFKFPYNYNGKSEIGIYFCVTADILTIVLLKCFWSSLYKPYEFCPDHWFWLVAMATERLNFQEKKKTFKNGNIPWVVLYQPYEFSPNCWIWLVAKG